jgi:hypothetical protein
MIDNKKVEEITVRTVQFFLEQITDVHDIDRDSRKASTQLLIKHLTLFLSTIITMVVIEGSPKEAYMDLIDIISDRTKKVVSLYI